MRTIRRVVMAAIIATLALGVVPAHAQPTSEDVQRCAAQPDMEGFEGSDRTCTYVDAEGHTRTVSIEGEDNSSRSTVGGGMFVFAVLWWIIPIFGGPYIAQRRGESIVIALVLTMVLGWIGLALVFAFQRRRTPLSASVPGRTPTTYV